MAIFEVNQGRVLTSLISGNYQVHEAIYEFVDNSVAAKATEVHIRVLDGDKKAPKAIVVYDNGSGMTSDELETSLVLACERDRSDYEISEFGVGYKAAAFSLGNQVWIVTKKDNQISAAFLDRSRINEQGEYDGPTEVDSDKALALWDKYSVNPLFSGTIFVINDLIQTEYKTCASLIGKNPKNQVNCGGLHRYNRLGLRYRELIDSGTIRIFTVSGMKGKPVSIESFDHCQRTQPDVDTLFRGSVSTKAGVNMRMTLTKLPQGSASGDFGIAITVADITTYIDGDTLLGMYNSGASHSYRWHLRGEVCFKTKKDFYNYFEFTSAKHGVLLKDTSFGDWLRDTDFGKYIIRESKLRSAAVQEEKKVKTLEAQRAADEAFVNRLNTSPSIYGKDAALNDKYFEKITAFQAGIFENNTVVSKLDEDTGILEYNQAHPKIYSLMSSGNIAKQDAARFIAAYNAVYPESGAFTFLLNGLAD
jgi:hypothetical protein|tara:strand:- start:727 stop:2157 length:1431 start_codon:yes stop_codon:yes gene_type:complete